MSSLILRGATFLALAGLTITGCGGFSGLILIGSARAPGTDGVVKTEKTHSGGTLVNIHMERLPPPEQLGEGVKTYLVWFEGKAGNPILAGPLKYQPEARTGDLIKACPWREFKIRITAERSTDAAAPSDLTVTDCAVSPK